MEATMNAHDCLTNALTCYRLAQGSDDTKIRKKLLLLMSEWRDLANEIVEREKSERLPT
jgi:hypothetical protein